MSLLLAEAASNSTLGISIFVLGGLAGATFYLPFKKVKQWAWESYWMIYAIVGLVVVPLVLAVNTSPNACDVLRHTPGKEIAYCYLCGAMWGIGGLTWGLMIRYLGFGLGLAIGCGLCSATGTLLPPILGNYLQILFHTAPAGLTSSQAILDGVHSLYKDTAAKTALVGVGVSLLGIIFVGMAGMSKENDLPEEEKKKAIAEYNFKKGIWIAIFSGLMSAGMSLGLNGGKTIESLALVTMPATPATWKGIPVLVVVLLGGFTINFLWCLLLNAKNRSFGDYVKPEGPLLLANLVFAALAGTIWCCQFIAFKTGEAAMGSVNYIGWAVLMASMIFFSGLLGIVLGEWKGTSGRTRGLLVLGLLLLFASAAIAGYSGSLKEKKEPAAQAAVIQHPTVGPRSA
jgi:L-rhamnose-H+ transport protein